MEKSVNSVRRPLGAKGRDMPRLNFTLPCIWTATSVHHGHHEQGYQQQQELQNFKNNQNHINTRVVRIKKCLGRLLPQPKDTIFKLISPTWTLILMPQYSGATSVGAYALVIAALCARFAEDGLSRLWRCNKRNS